MAVKARGSITITDITDAYSVFLSNEAHTFIGNTDSAIAGTATTNVYAFLGAEQLPVTIGEITCPTGMTAKISNNGTTSALITFTVTTALKTGGAVSIPVTITGKDISITKAFTYSIAFTGEPGAKGEPGAAGRGVKSTEVKYQANSSGSDIPTGTWLTDIPTVSAGQYLWTRTIISYTDNTTSTSYSVGMMGAAGDKGDKGEPGATGKGVKSTAVTYQKGTSGTTAPTGTWGTTIPTVNASEYLWTKTVITYTDNTTSTSYSVGMMGATGDKGDKGDPGDAGEDAILLGYTASNGVHFKNGSGTTTLTALVYKGGVQQTVNDNGVCDPLGTVKWYKDGTLVGTGKQLVVNAEDVDSIAVYEVTLEG